MPQTSLNLDRIRIQLKRVSISAATYVRECLVAGQMLLEERSLLIVRSDRPWKDHTKQSDERFDRVILSLSLKIPTAYRWMDAAQRVAKAVWPDRSIDQIDGHLVAVTEEDVCLISEVLTAPDEEQDEARRRCKSHYFGLISGKSINECLRGIIIDADDPSAFTRSYNGQTEGGFNGEDRGDWPVFVAKKWSHINSHLANWDHMSQTQRTEIKQVMRAAINGGEVRLPGEKRKGNFHYESALPREVAEMLAEAIKERLKSDK